jgi:hypothetical protein
MRLAAKAAQRVWTGVSARLLGAVDMNDLGFFMVVFGMRFGVLVLWEEVDTDTKIRQRQAPIGNLCKDSLAAPICHKMLYFNVFHTLLAQRMD